MALINPVELFKERPELLGEFLRALSTLHQTGVLEMLRERGQVRPTSENSPNYVAAQAAKASWSLGYNHAIDDLVYFKDRFLASSVTTQPAPAFGSLDRALNAGDLTEEEINAIRNDTPIPQLKRELGPDAAAFVEQVGKRANGIAAGGAGGIPKAPARSKSS